jgi:sodium-dependent dicarboxylate transporter 2/3/5
MSGGREEEAKEKEKTGPLPVWRKVGLVLGPVVFLLIAFVPSGLHRIEGQGHRPAYAAGVAALMAVWWFTEALPIAWTACVPLVLYPALDVFGGGVGGSAVKAFEPYVDPYIFLFMGGMGIGAAMEQWGLHRRIALHIMRRVGTDPPRLLLGMLIATATVSLWISNTATAVMMMPIGLALLHQVEAGEGGKRLSYFGAAIMLAVAYGANVGGIGTKIGTATNAIFAGYVADKLQYDIGFLQFMAIGLPFVALFIPVAWGVLWRLARRDALTSHPGREVLDRELAAMGAPSRGERTVAAVFFVAAVLWIGSSPLREALAPLVGGGGFKLREKHVESAVAMLAAVSLLLLRSLSFQALRKVPWDTLLLLGGSFAMAAGIEGSGLSRWMALQLAALEQMPLFGQLLLASLASVVLSAVASNTATVNVMLNVLPRSLTVLSVSAMASSCDFALPAGTPPNAIVFGSGYIRLPTMMKIGVVLDVLAAVVLAVYGALYVRHLLPS